MSADVKLLECTLRDGSYSVDFQFTEKDTAIILSSLQNIGFEYIEIGHGLGLHASDTSSRAAETDETYLRVAQEILDRAKFGMFFIPGIGRVEDLELAHRYEMDFVRIGTNVTEIERSKEFVKYAKDLGFTVFSNLMKTYALSPSKVAENARLAEEYGADVVVIVDSAGGMLPGDVGRYISAFKEGEVGTEIGFHGHNNLALAVANSIEAMMNGASFIDTTLGGIGRSSGNAATETILSILKKMGRPLPMDIIKVMDLADTVVRPLIRSSSEADSVSIISGYADFHSSFLDTVLEASKRYTIDPRELIVQLSTIDKVNVPPDLANRLAEEIWQHRAGRSEVVSTDFLSNYSIRPQAWETEVSLEEKAQLVASHLQKMGKKTGKQTIFTINISILSPPKRVVFPSVHESSSYLMASAELPSIKDITNVGRVIDGKVDFLIIDDEQKLQAQGDLLASLRDIISRSTLLTYRDNATWIQAIDSFLSCRFGSLHAETIAIIGLNDLSKGLAISLANRGARVTIHDPDGKEGEVSAINRVCLATAPFRVSFSSDAVKACHDARVIVGFDKIEKINTDQVKAMHEDGGLIVDATLGCVDNGAIELARERGITIWRTDMRAAMAGEMTTVLRTHQMQKHMGRGEIAGISVVAGGILGEEGDVVVDSIIEPSKVIGIADGRGNLLYGGEPDYVRRTIEVEREILWRKINKRQFFGGNH